MRIRSWSATVLCLLATVLFVCAGNTVAHVQADASERVEARLKVAGDADPAQSDLSSQDALLAPRAVLAVTPNAANYVFATSTTASLDDMSAGTTALVGADMDDVASSVTLIGFDFYFLGVRQDRFSVNSNGSLRLGATPISVTAYDPLSQASQSVITAYGADQRTHAGDGKVHYKVTGSAPNRKLSVEWLNMQADFNSGGTADLTYQVHLYETTGQIEFVYGSMNMSANGAADPNSQSPQLGFSSNNTVGTVGTITAAQSGTPAPTFSGASASPANNVYVAGSIPALTSALDGARRTFTLTPSSVVAPGGPLTFTGISATGMTLNWTDSPNEAGYTIYQSTDGGATFNVFGSAAGDATSFPVSNLFAGTNYTWRVSAFNEGSVASIVASQATISATPNMGMGGVWSLPSTWSTGQVPTANDAVTIVSGATVVIDTAAIAYSVTVAGTLQFEQTTARTLTVGTDVTVQSGGVLQSNPAGTQTGHTLSLAGSLTNNGTFDFSTNADTAGAILAFSGPVNATFGGTGATTDIRQITLNKGTTSAPILEIKPTNFTVRGVTTDTVVGGWLVMTNGTLKLSGTFTGSSRVFPSATYTIPVSFGFWLNNPNYVVAGQAGSATLNGVLHVSNGVFNIGTATGNTLGFATGSTVIVDGGSINATGRFGVAAAGNAVNYTQSAGTITVCTIGNPSTTLGSFDLGTSLNSNIAISGGTIVTQLLATAIDYRNQAGSGIAGITGGTLQIGNAGSGAAKLFNLRGVLPNVVVTSTSANHTATMSTTLVNFNNVSLNITIASGATFNIGNVLLLMGGTTLTNNGTLTANGASSNFIWFDIGAGLGPQTYTGTGTTTVPVTAMSIEAAQSVTFTSTNPFITNRVNLFSGTLINSNKITLGTGGATTGVVQIGNTTTPSAAGTFDSAPTFNLGTGGQIVSYLRTNSSRVTGPEINPTRVLTSVAYDDNDPTHTLTIAGGNLTATGALTLSNGRVITGANTLVSGSAGTVTRTAGYVDGNFRKTFTAAASRTFEVGTANGYTPIIVNATAGTFPADVTAAAVQGTAPGVTPVAEVISRYWNIVANGITADVIFSYLDPIDIPGSVTEASLHVLQKGTANPSDYADIGGTINTAANTATVTGLTTFSTFTLGTAEADVGISIDDGVSSVAPGDTIVYQIVASNGGTIGNPAAVINDTFPASLTCSTTCTGSNGGTCTAGPVAGNINDTANLPAGASVTYQATCQVDPSATGSIIDTVTIAGGAVTDNHSANNSASDTDDLTGADISITNTDGVTSAIPGGGVTYSITASNPGPSNATGATVTDMFPASLTCSWTCSGAGGGTCSASGSGNINSSVDLPAGSSVTYIATCAISPSASGTLSNLASLISPVGVPDPDTSNNTATDSDELTAQADLGVTVTDGVATVHPGSSVTYTITASNAGLSSVASANVTDAFPAVLTTCSWTCTGAGGGTCSASGNGNISDVVNLPPAGSVTYIATCMVSSAAASGTLDNAVSVSSATMDTHLSNNNAVDSDAISAAHLTMTFDDDHPYARYGQIRDYLLQISNTGPDTATDINVSETLSSDFFAPAVHWSCFGGDGGASCAASGTGALSDSNVVIPASRSLTWLISVPINTDAPNDTADNAITVSSAFDPDAPHTVTDSDVLVIFRDGFDVDFADGTDSTLSSLQLQSIEQTFGSGQSLIFKLPAAAGTQTVETLVRGHALDGKGFRIERLNLPHVTAVRIVSVGLLGMEEASAWLRASTSSSVMFDLSEVGGTLAILATSDGETSLNLAAGAQPLYQVDATAGAMIAH
jgi:uncharacterized repeat protein (TIGR01451 family)